MEDKIFLYALLCLANTGPSLNAVMSIITESGHYSGLLINWDKSVLLPLDPLPSALAGPAASITVV